MLTGFTRKIELAANLAILVVSCLLAVVLVKAYFLSEPWAVSARTNNLQRKDEFIPVVITEHLEAKNGLIPADLRCGTARLSTANQLEEFRCVLKNNTQASITAASTIYTIVYEQNGSLFKDSFSSVAEAFVHKDFKGTNKLIEPGNETSFGPPGPISYADGVIKSVEIAIDYVEFEDGSTLGPDKKGSRIIEAMRAGAERYREWLKVRTRQSHNYVDTISSAVEMNQSLPSELRFTDPGEEQGANAYRSRLRKLYQNRGPAEVKKLLDSN